MMPTFYQLSIPALWVAWLLFWSVAAIGAKRDVRREGIGSRLSHLLPLGLAIALFTMPHPPLAWLASRFLPRSAVGFWVGFALVVGGLGFTVLARLWLGTNWSGLVTLKQDHQLVRSGPYALVRHPIYSGLLLAFLGSAIALGQWRGLVALALVVAAFLRKISIEERFLARQFGKAYASYRADVPALLPMPRQPSGCSARFTALLPGTRRGMPDRRSD